MKTNSIYANNKNWLILLLFISFSISSYAQGTMKEKNSVAINVHDGNIEWGNCPDIIPSGCKVAFLNGNPAENNADAIFRFEPNTDIPEHWHNSAERMILIQGELEVTYEGEKTKTLKAGNYAYGPARKPHKAKCKGGEPCLLFVAFEQPVDAFAGKGK